MPKLFFSVVVLAAVNLTALSMPGLGPQESPQKPSAAAPAVLVPAPVPAQQQEPPAAAVPSPPAPQARTAPPVVVLDPAHGGSDSGARGAAGAVESELVLEFARAIRVALEGQGLHVLLTREGNQGLSFDARSAMINGQRGAIFISLHISSTGPAGTARTYWYSLPSGTAAAPATVTTSAAQTPPLATPPESAPHRGLVQWDQAQLPYLDSSRRLAETVQTQIARKFSGSNGMPEAAPVRQLRTIAAPGIAIEVSSVAVPDAQQLIRMAAPLAEAVARGVADFRAAAGGDR